MKFGHRLLRSSGPHPSKGIPRTVFISRYSLFPEVLAWTTALVIPIFIDPGIATHFSWCLFKNAGLWWCPGCGLGESIALLYRGDVAGSFHAHPLGMFAVLILLSRIAVLLKKHNLINSNQHEQINEHHSRP